MPLSGSWTLCGWKALLGWKTDTEISMAPDCPLLFGKLCTTCALYILYYGKVVQRRDSRRMSQLWSLSSCRHVNAKFGYLKSSYLRLSASASGLVIQSVLSGMNHYSRTMQYNLSILMHSIAKITVFIFYALRKVELIFVVSKSSDRKFHCKGSFVES